MDILHTTIKYVFGGRAIIGLLFGQSKHTLCYCNDWLKFRRLIYFVNFDIDIQGSEIHPKSAGKDILFNICFDSKLKNIFVLLLGVVIFLGQELEAFTSKLFPFYHFVLVSITHFFTWTYSIY